MALRASVWDYETASNCDLKKAGSWRYAEDPTTEILCLAFDTAENKVPRVWTPSMGPEHPITLELRALAEDPSVTVIAHHAEFEKAIYRTIMVAQWGWPDIPDGRWHDTQASCAMKVLPQDLDGAVRVLRLPYQKDKEGSALTISLSKPNRKTGRYDRSPETLARVYKYCASDIYAERGLLERTGWLPPGERRVWLLDQRINERGCRLDLDYIRAAQRVVDLASVPLQAEFRNLTGGLGVGQRDKILKWLVDQGVNLPNMKKETLVEILGPMEGDEDADEIFSEGDETDTSALPPTARRALRIRQLIGSASIKKLARMEACICSDGRARGLLAYHGAGPGRWAGRILQPHNFPRGSLRLGEGAPSPEIVYNAIMSGDPEFIQLVVGPPVETVVSGLRHCLIPGAGRSYVSGDYTQIELRVLLALAGADGLVDKLAAGATPYQDMAKLIFGRPVDKHNDIKEYTIGKNTVLGAGFQMGGQKFHDRYWPSGTLEECDHAIQVYRKEFAPEVPRLWYALENAAVRTVHEGTPHEAYGVLYQLEDGWLTARLPSGRKLWYFNPRPCRKAMPWDPTDVRMAFTYQAKKMGRWITIDAYGGLLTENVVQGLARDVLVVAMFLLEANGFPLALTVHDEALAEPQSVDADEKALKEIMLEGADWIRALRVPLNVDTWMGDRYRK